MTDTSQTYQERYTYNGGSRTVTLETIMDSDAYKRLTAQNRGLEDQNAQLEGEVYKTRRTLTFSQAADRLDDLRAFLGDVTSDLVIREMLLMNDEVLLGLRDSEEVTQGLRNRNTPAILLDRQMGKIGRPKTEVLDGRTLESYSLKLEDIRKSADDIQQNLDARHRRIDDLRHSQDAGMQERVERLQTKPLEDVRAQAANDMAERTEQYQEQLELTQRRSRLQM